ncbi:MAG: hypothetical protein AAGJ91_06560 [Pseudomonadota bacterium]
MFIIVALMVVFVLVLLSGLRRSAACRWREDRSVDVEGLSYWRCHVCNATDKTVKGRPPGACRAPRR